MGQPLDTGLADGELATLQDRVIDQITLGQQDAIDALETAGTVMIEGIGRTQQQFADFVAERIEADLDAQNAMLRCRSLGEMRRIQIDYVRASFGQMGGEMSRMLRLGGQLAARSMERPWP